MAVVALLGASGNTGGRVLSRALTAGHVVRVLVRDPARLGPVAEDERVVVVVGDVLDAVAVSRTVAGAEVVLSLFGQVKGSPRQLQTRGMELVVEAMRKYGVSRLVTLSGGGLRVPQDRPRLPDRLIRAALKVMAGHVLADAEGHLAVLRRSVLDWTVVRGPILTDDPGKGHCRVGWVGVGTGIRISRDDLADFILTQVPERRFVGQLPFVSE